MPRKRQNSGRSTQPNGSVQGGGSVHAIGYVRVSTEEQARFGVSLDAQIERIRAYALMSSLTLDQIISEEGVSASKPLRERPGGARLVIALGAGQAQHVIALKLDRLFRDAEDALQQTKAWDRAGLALHLIDMGGATLNTASAMGRFFLNMMAGFAELERNLISERTATALNHKKRTRRVYGPIPFGFSGEGDQLVANATEAAVLEMIQAFRGRGQSLRAIAGQLNAAGIARKRGGKKWYASTVGKILGNDIHQVAA